MPNFDFHNNLSPEEFERFIRDILEIRDFPLKFRTYRKGKDGGIDFKCTNSSEKIIGQTKLYQNNYNQLKATLIKELVKVKRLKPHRYILATSVRLTPSQTQDILTLFKGYILSAEDILDEEQLNKYLGQEKYKYLLKTYSKLLVPDLNFLENSLEDIVNRPIKTVTERELKKIKKNRIVFVQTNTFFESLEFLIKNKVIIISGNPGVGKTTIAHMMINYILVSEENKIDFIKVGNLNEVDRVFNTERKQIFLWDDFWGQNFAEAPNETNYYRNFTQALNDFAIRENHYLIITSREYIIQTVCSKQGKDSLSNIDLNKFTLKVDDFSDEEKVRILLNHVYFAEFGKEYFYRFKYNDETLGSIIQHPNYSPRHIDYFINKICSNEFLTQNKINEYSFYSYLRKYLSNPQQFWEEIFAKQTETAQLILIILLISSDPMSIKDLKQSFLNIQSKARNLLNLNILPLSFDDEINALEELFIRTEPLEYSEEILVYFQSPGIKDFLLEYLRTKIDFYGEPLISGAIFFNQLNFVFTTQVNTKVYDESFDTALYGEKIMLYESLQEKLKEKLLSEFHSLNFGLSKDLYDDISYPSSSEESKYWKLILLNQFFNIYLEENADVRQFIINEIFNDIKKYNIATKEFLSHKSMSHFPHIIKLLKEFVSFDEKLLIEAYYQSIKFTNEFISFYEFREIFPEEFASFLAENLLLIRKKIKSTILDDIQYYLDERLDYELDTLIEYEIDEVFKIYGLRMTKSFQDEMADASWGEISFAKKKKVKKNLSNISKKNLKSKRKAPKFEKIVEEYLGNEDFSNFNYKSYLKELDLDSSKYKKLLAFKKENELIDDYFEDEISISILADYLKANEVNFSSAFHFYDRIGNYLLQKINEELKIENVNKLASFFQQLAFEIFTSEALNDGWTTTSKDIAKTSNKELQKKLDISLLYPLIVKRNNWFEFLNTGLLNYFVSRKIVSELDNEKYSKCLESVVLCNFENNIKVFELLKSVDHHRIEKQFFEPSIIEFQNSIKANSNRETVTKFFNFFEPEFEFVLNKKRRNLKKEDSPILQQLSSFYWNTQIKIFV